MIQEMYYFSVLGITFYVMHNKYVVYERNTEVLNLY